MILGDFLGGRFRNLFLQHARGWEGGVRGARRGEAGFLFENSRRGCLPERGGGGGRRVSAVNSWGVGAHQGLVVVSPSARDLMN